MNIQRAIALLLLALPLAACASSDSAKDSTAAASAVEARQPEVRYYVIADT